MPPKWLLVPPQTKTKPPPSEDCAPKKLTGSGLLDGVQIEIQIGDVFKTFFFEITCIRPEKVLEFAIAAGKSLWIFASHLVQLIQAGINFSCPGAPLEFKQNKLLVPPQNLFLLPQVTLSWRRACFKPVSTRRKLVCVWAIDSFVNFSKKFFVSTNFTAVLAYNLKFTMNKRYARTLRFYSKCRPGLDLSRKHTTTAAGYIFWCLPTQHWRLSWRNENQKIARAQQL